MTIQPVSMFDGGDASSVVALMTADEATDAEREIITTGNRLRLLLVEA